MTKARDIANLVDSNGDIVTGALDNVPPSNDASALTTGTLDVARISNGSITSAKLTGGKPFNVRQLSTNNLWGGITHGANNGNAYGYYYSDVGMSSYVTSDTIALMIRVHYTHGGAANHGYLGGYVIQAGETDAFPNRADWYMAHYNDYYNTDSTNFLMPWNPAGTQTLRFNVTSSHNTSSSNAYAIQLAGTIERST